MLREYIALDTETTGLSPEEDRIIEIGAVRVGDGRVIDVFDRLINPHRPLPEMITQLTGISGEMLAGAPSLSEVMPELISFCGSEVIVGHQLAFDYRFLKIAAVSCHLPFEKKGIDTLQLSRKLCPELPSRTLSAMCSHFGLGDFTYHRAHEDARAAAMLLEALAGRYETSHPELFAPRPMLYKVKKKRPAKAGQLKYLQELCAHHQIACPEDLLQMDMGQVSRLTDQIILRYGRL